MGLSLNDMKKYSYAISFIFELDTDLSKEDLYHKDNISTVYDSLKKAVEDCINNKDTDFYILDTLEGDELNDYREAKNHNGE